MPFTRNDRATTPKGAAAVVPVFDNDVLGAGVYSIIRINGVDVDVGATVTLASGALVVINSDGTLTYDPNDAFDPLTIVQSRQDSFTYEVLVERIGTDG